MLEKATRRELFAIVLKIPGGHLTPDMSGVPLNLTKPSERTIGFNLLLPVLWQCSVSESSIHDSTSAESSASENLNWPGEVTRVLPRGTKPEMEPRCSGSWVYCIYLRRVRESDPEAMDVAFYCT